MAAILEYSCYLSRNWQSEQSISGKMEEKQEMDTLHISNGAHDYLTTHRTINAVNFISIHVSVYLFGSQHLYVRKVNPTKLQLGHTQHAARKHSHRIELADWVWRIHFIFYVRLKLTANGK